MDGVKLSPSFSGCSQTLNVVGNMTFGLTLCIFSPLNGNLIVTGNFLISGATMSFTKNGRTFTVGGTFDIEEVNAITFARSALIQIHRGDMTFTNSTLNSFSNGGITVTCCDILIVNLSMPE